jgi:hypothetical protein
MTKRVQFLLAIAVITMTVAACHKGPLLGFSTDTYVNQNDARQTLEFHEKETVKGFISGRSPNPFGWWTLFNGQKGAAGGYTRVENTFILKSNENQEFKLALQPDGSLRDQSGNIWQHQSRSHSFRTPDDLASR